VGRSLNLLNNVRDCRSNAPRGGEADPISPPFATIARELFNFHAA